jgi:hypothetical protein
MTTAPSTPTDRAFLVLALVLALVPALVLALAPAAGAESRPRRQGFAFGIGLGSGGTHGFGIEGIGGAGGSATLHVGTTASERMLWLLQLDISADPHTVDEGEGKTTIVNQHTTLTLGAQYYAREAVWIKGGLGLSGLALGRDAEAAGDMGRQMNGLGLMSAGGYDLLRSGMFALSLELAANAGIYQQGVIASLGVRLSANWY